MRRLRNRLHKPAKRTMPASFHMQADWAVIGVFFLEILKETTVIAAPMIGVAVILGIFFGGES